jgi:hypothetical protein
VRRLRNWRVCMTKCNGSPSSRPNGTATGRGPFRLRERTTRRVGLTRFDGHPSSGVCPRKDVRSWRAWGRSPGVAAPSRLSSRPRSWSCASAGTAQQGRSKDFDLTDRGAGVGQAGRTGCGCPAGRGPDQRRAAGAGRAAAGEPLERTTALPPLPG